MLNFKCCVPAPELPHKEGVYGLVGVKETFWEKGETIRWIFLDGSADQQALWRKCLEVWSKHVGLVFEEQVRPSLAEVRVSFVRGIGSWSYLGTQCRSITNYVKPTMNLGWDDEGTYLHEIGHMLGFGHEHQNPKGGINWNLEQLIEDLSGPPNNWSVEQIYHNVIDAYSEDQVMGTEVDKDSIMMYPIPQRWTVGNFSTMSNDSLSDLDKEWANKIYPKKGVEPPVDPNDPVSPVCPEPTPPLSESELVSKVLIGLGLNTHRGLRRLLKKTLYEIVIKLGIRPTGRPRKSELASIIEDYLNQQ